MFVYHIVHNQIFKFTFTYKKYNLFFIRFIFHPYHVFHFKCGCYLIFPAYQYISCLIFNFFNIIYMEYVFIIGEFTFLIHLHIIHVAHSIFAGHFNVHL